jgi:peptidoglycan/xylan/chitin deacetylase (PgdA/CDA1 family)
MKLFDLARTAKWNILKSMIAATPFEMIRRVVRGQVVSLYYHVVADELKPHLSELYSNVHTVKTFGAELDFLKKHFNPITASQLFSHIENQEPLPENPCLITFDDGYREVYENAFPQLKEREIPFVLFLTSDFVDNKTLFVENTASLILNRCNEDPAAASVVERLLVEHGVVNGTFRQCLQRIPYHHRALLESAARACGIDSNDYAAKNRPYVEAIEVREMLESGLVEVGAHGIDHARNDDLTPNEQYQQVAGSLTTIVEQFDLPIRLYAFPYSDRAIAAETYQRLFRDLKIHLAFGTEQLRPSMDRRIIQRCWMDACHGETPKAKISRLFQTELLCQMQVNRVAERG